jgi:hypothetical protein
VVGGAKRVPPGEQWPIERWLEPPHYTGPRDRRELIRNKNAERVTSTTALMKAVAARVNAAGLNLRAHRRSPKDGSADSS